VEQYQLKYSYNELVDIHRRHLEFDAVFTDETHGAVLVTIVLGNDIPDPLFITVKENQFLLGTYRTTDRDTLQAIRVACFMKPQLLLDLFYSTMNCQVMDLYDLAIAPVDTFPLQIGKHVGRRLQVSLGVVLYAFGETVFRYSQRDETLEAVTENTTDITVDDIKSLEALCQARQQFSAEAANAFYR